MRSSLRRLDGEAAVTVVDLSARYSWLPQPAGEDR